MITITIDTCLINSKQTHKDMNKLEEFSRKGLIEIVVAERLYQETENNDKRLKKAKLYENIGEPFCIGHSRIGSAYISDGKKRPTFKDIANVLFPNINHDNLSNNQANDIMHLISHIHSESNYFITDNTHDFIDAKKDNSNRNGSYKNIKKQQLEYLGIKVRTPSEMIEELYKIYGIK